MNNHIQAEQLGKPYATAVLSVLAAYNLIEQSTMTDDIKQACAEAVGYIIMNSKTPSIQDEVASLYAVANLMGEITAGLDELRKKNDAGTMEVEAVIEVMNNATVKPLA